MIQTKEIQESKETSNMAVNVSNTGDGNTKDKAVTAHENRSTKNVTIVVTNDESGNLESKNKQGSITPKTKNVKKEKYDDDDKPRMENVKKEKYNEKMGNNNKKINTSLRKSHDRKAKTLNNKSTSITRTKPKAENNRKPLSIKSSIRSSSDQSSIADSQSQGTRSSQRSTRQRISELAKPSPLRALGALEMLKEISNSQNQGKLKTRQDSGRLRRLSELAKPVQEMHENKLKSTTSSGRRSTTPGRRSTTPGRRSTTPGRTLSGQKGPSDVEDGKNKTYLKKGGSNRRSSLSSTKPKSPQSPKKKVITLYEKIVEKNENVVLKKSQRRSTGAPDEEICVLKWQPQMHSAKAGCDRCIFFADKKTVQQYDAHGHSPRIMMTCGGCVSKCAFFPRTDKEQSVRLCQKCFHDTHMLKLW